MPARIPLTDLAGNSVACLAVRCRLAALGKALTPHMLQNVQPRSLPQCHQDHLPDTGQLAGWGAAPSAPLGQYAVADDGRQPVQLCASDGQVRALL